MSGQPKWTGPWHVGGKNGTIVFDAEGWAICDAKTGHGRQREGAEQIHARLIAAAPCLAEALAAILAHPRTDDRSIVFMPHEVEAARAALAKARGEA